MKSKKISIKIVLLILLVMMLTVLTGCSDSDAVLGLSGIGVLISIAGFIGAIVQAIVSALGFAISGVVGVITLFVKLIGFIISLF